MNRHGKLIAPDTVRFQRLLPGTLEQVWQFLTDGDKRGLWLAGGSTEPRLGGRVTLEFHNSGLSSLPDDPPPEKYADLPEHMFYEGVVTAWEPMTRFSHTWVGDDGENSEVTYELESLDEGVLLTLTHRRLSTEMLTGVLGGWHTHLDILINVMQGLEPQPFWRAHTALEAEYEKMQA